MAAHPRCRSGRLIAAMVGAVALALAGCGVGGPSETVATPQLTSKLEGQTIEGAGNTRLALAEWTSESPRAVILGVHGFGDYGPSTFSGAARHWAARGIQVYAYDQRGFGRNPSRGHWPGANALVDDLIAVSGRVRASHPCLPIAIVGHSMGGGVALAAAARGLDADALVLAAPALWGGAELNPLHRLMAWSAAAVVPEKRFTGEGVVRIQASDNLEVLRALGRDPLYLARPSAREIMGLVRVTDLAAAAAPDVRLPSLLLLGEKDEIVPNASVRRVHARMPGPSFEITYPEGWHLLFRDLQAERVWHDVAEWTLQQPERACPD